METFPLFFQRSLPTIERVLQKREGGDGSLWSRIGFNQFHDWSHLKELRIFQETVQSFHEVDSWGLSRYLNAAPLFKCFQSFPLKKELKNSAEKRRWILSQNGWTTIDHVDWGHSVKTKLAECHRELQREIWSSFAAASDVTNLGHVQEQTKRLIHERHVQRW